MERQKLSICCWSQLSLWKPHSWDRVWAFPATPALQETMLPLDSTLPVPATPRWAALEPHGMNLLGWSPKAVCLKVDVDWGVRGKQPNCSGLLRIPDLTRQDGKTSASVSATDFRSWRKQASRYYFIWKKKSYKLANSNTLYFKIKKWAQGDASLV